MFDLTDATIADLFFLQSRPRHLPLETHHICHHVDCIIRLHTQTTAASIALQEQDSTPSGISCTGYQQRSFRIGYSVERVHRRTIDDYVEWRNVHETIHLKAQLWLREQREVGDLRRGTGPRTHT